MMKSKDTIDKLNRLEFFYWCKPPKTPEVLEQDREQTKKDFELIRKELEILEIIRTHKLLNYIIKNKKCATMYHLTDEESNTLKRWVEYEN